MGSIHALGRLPNSQGWINTQRPAGGGVKSGGPFITIVAVLFGSTLLGVLGAIVAIPIAASIQILLREYFDWRTLSIREEPVPDEPDEPPDRPDPPAAGEPVPA